MDKNIKNINAKIIAFKRQHYLGIFIRGGALTFSLVLFYFLIISLIEHSLWMNQSLRLTLLLSFVGMFIYCFFVFLKKPVVWWIFRKGLGQEESAKIIGSFFPAISDQLLNLIQLSRHQHRTPLLEASIAQKAKAVENFTFKQAVDMGSKRRYLWFFFIPIVVVLIVLLTSPAILTQSAKRIVRFDQKFTPPALFSFHVLNNHMNAFLNEDFTLHLQLEGVSLPATMYILSGSQKLKMEPLSSFEYKYTFKKVQAAIPFQLEAEGTFSQSFLIGLIHRPELTQISTLFRFPKYLFQKNEALLNTGHFEVPEGTHVTWQIGATNTSVAKIGFSPPETESLMLISNDTLFTSSRVINDSGKYWISLANETGRNKNKIAYPINVIKDQYPRISVSQFADSVLFKTLLLNGQIADDHGLTELILHYSKTSNSITSNSHSIPIAVQKNHLQQHFFHSWQLDSLHLKPGEYLRYFLEIWDNDGVNGRKSTRSPTYTFALPNKTEIKDDLATSQAQTKTKLNEGIKKIRNLSDIIDKARQHLQGKKSMAWQDKKLLEEILHKKDSIYLSIEELQQQHRLLNEKRKVFLKQDMQIVKRAEQIQKLMDEILDEKTKALFKELQRLLNENSNLNQLKDVLEKLDRKENDLENAFKRMLELLELFRFDTALDQTIQSLKEEIKEQKALLGKTQNKDEENNFPKKSENYDGKKLAEQSQSTKSLAEKQKMLSDKSDILKKDLSNLKKMGEKIGNNPMLPSPQEVDEIKNAQEKSKHSLEQNNKKKSMEWQQQSIDKMQHLQAHLEKTQDAMQMDIDVKNMALLRHILHGLIKLSYDQESLINEFHNIKQTDPQYVDLGQRQLKVKNDFKVLKDSLLSLSEKDPFISSIVVSEIGDLSSHLDKALKNIQERKPTNNGSTEMQWSMTGINNLALMLDAHFDMMQNAKSGTGQGKKRHGQPNLSQLQKQLNEQISTLKKSGKTGRPLSEALAKMAAEQEQIRRAFQRLQEKLSQGQKNPLQALPGKMEQTEMDLLNKQITQETLNRQKEILSRLLKAENSLREQGWDKERKGTSAREYQKKLSTIFEESLKLRKKEVELLKTVPPKLNSYYKKEVRQYFGRIKNQ